MHRRIMAFDVAKYHEAEFRKHGQSFGPNLTSLIEEGLAISKTRYEQAVQHQALFQRDCRSQFSDVRVLLSPSTPTAAPRDLSTTGDPRFNSPWSYSGHATVTLPCGLTAEKMPLGLQLIGLGTELELLAQAAWCEDVIGFMGEPA